MPWSRTCVVSHCVYSPWSHIQQLPQQIWNGRTTRSPTWRSPTWLPTSSTMPIGSWPRMSPSPMNGFNVSYRWRSEPHSPLEVIRTIASLGSLRIGSGTSSTRTSRRPCQVTAFIVRPPRGMGDLSLDDRVDGLLQRARLGRATRCPLADLQHPRAQVLQDLPAETLTDLGEPLLLLLVHVVPDVLDQDRGLGGEPLVLGLHRGELDHEHVGHVVLLVGLQDVVLQVREQLADLRVHHLVLEVGVHREELDHRVDELALGDVSVLTGLLEVVEYLADLLVLVLEQHDGVGGHGAPVVEVGGCVASVPVRGRRTPTSASVRRPARA